MDVAPTTNLLDDMLEFILARPTLEEIIAYEVPKELDQRLHYLLDRNNQDTLQLEERAELDEFLRIGHILRMLKAKARLKLADKA